MFAKYIHFFYTTNILDLIYNMHTAIIIVIILIFVWMIARMNNNVNEQFMMGLWVADSEFCKEADLDSMLIFIGESYGWINTNRSCYIIAQSNKNIIINQGFTLSYHQGFAGPGYTSYNIKCNVYFDDFNPWSDKVYITVNMMDGSMRIYNNDILFARLYRNNEISSNF